MKAVIEWFNGNKDYNTGVAIYAKSTTVNIRILSNLKRGYNRRNFALLVAELRKLKKQKTVPTQPKQIVKKTQQVTQDVISTEATNKQLKNESVKQEFSKVMIGELPASLRLRYSKAYHLFIQMIELKFALNDLPPQAENDALKIIIEIDQLDDERDLIWQEIRHWKKFKTLLPSTTTDYSELSQLERYKKFKNLKSSITKIEKRVDLLYDELANATKKSLQFKIETKINNSEKRIHQHRINVAKLKELL